LSSFQGGFDALHLLSVCRQMHQSPENIWMGINMEDGTVVDMVNKMRVIEPANVLESVIKCATEVAEMIVRVDVNIRMKPLKSFVQQSNQ
jgi:chaperonin GroEL (HSP60 family)